MKENSIAENAELRALVERFAEHAGLEESEREAVAIAASLIAVGRLPLVDVLEKAGPLSDEDRARIREIPRIWSEFTSQLPPLAELRVPETLGAFAENWDGSGYPAGLAGEAIPFAARALAVCYHYTGMTSDRPYRPALSRDDALAEMMKMSGSKLDPMLVAVFVGMMREG